MGVEYCFSQPAAMGNVEQFSLPEPWPVCGYVESEHQPVVRKKVTPQLY
jgi:hypothetical protein